MPASLKVLRLQNSCHIALEDVGSLRRGLSAAVVPVLAVRAATINCNCGQSAPSSVNATRHVSRLPDGFSALELETPHITVVLQHVVHDVTPTVAARHLCRFFAGAPPSYRRFSVYWAGGRPLRVHLKGSSAARADGSVATDLCDVEPVAFDTVAALAVQLKDCAKSENIGVAVHIVEEPMQGTVVVRL